MYIMAMALMCCAVGHSQTSEIPITYIQYMNMVDSGNLDLAAQKLNVSIAQAAIIAAKVRNDPELGFSYFNNEQAKKKMGYGGSVTLSQTFSFGKRSAGIALAQSESELSKALLADYLRNLQADATLSFLQALKLKMFYQVQKDAYQNVLDLAKADSLRFVKGKIMGIDATQSKLEAGVLYTGLMQAATGRDQAYMDLSLYMGTKNMSFMYHPQATLHLPYYEFRLNELIQNGLDNRADLVAALQNIDVANKALKVARREKNSDVTVSVELGHNAEVKNEIAPAPSFNSIVAGVTIPLPFSKLNKGSVNVARQRLNQAKIQYEQASLTVRNQIMKAYCQYEASWKQVQHYERNLLQQAKMVLKGKTYSYNRGESSLLEVLNAQRTYDDVQNLYFEALFDYGSAMVELERASGIWNMDKLIGTSSIQEGER